MKIIVFLFLYTQCLADQFLIAPAGGFSSDSKTGVCVDTSLPERNLVLFSSITGKIWAKDISSQESGKISRAVIIGNNIYAVSFRGHVFVVNLESKLILEKKILNQTVTNIWKFEDSSILTKSCEWDETVKQFKFYICKISLPILEIQKKIEVDKSAELGYSKGKIYVLTEQDSFNLDK